MNIVVNFGQYPCAQSTAEVQDSNEIVIPQKIVNQLARGPGITPQPAKSKFGFSITTKLT